MGEVLAGTNAAWEFGTDSVRIRYDRGIRTPKLLHVLGERTVPYQALESVELVSGRRGAVVLRARPRPGADPVMEAADGQLRETADPYRLVLPAGRATLAEYYADELRTAVAQAAPAPAERFLVDGPAPPLQFKAIDAKAAFDGRAVTFRLFWSGASSAKWKAGDQRFPVDRLAGVRWRSPEVIGGYLRLLLPDVEQPADPGQDPAAVTFGIGYGLVHESLPFAASVLSAIGPVPDPERPRPAAEQAPQSLPRARSSPDEVAARIRHLGELHSAGLVTDEEFSAKKADLLAEL